LDELSDNLLDELPDDGFVPRFHHPGSGNEDAKAKQKDKNENGSKVVIDLFVQP